MTVIINRAGRWAGVDYAANQSVNNPALEQTMVNAGFATWAPGSGPSSSDGGVLRKVIDPVSGPVLSPADMAVLAVSGFVRSYPSVSYSNHTYIPMTAGLTNLAAAPVDVTGNGNHMTLGAAISAAECNANAGYMTTKAATNGHLVTKMQANWATDVIVMSFVMNMAAPAALVFFAGSNDYLASETGLSFGCGSDGKLRVYMAGAGAITAGGGLAYLAGATVVVADGTDHKVGLAYDYKQRALFVWVDGVLVLSLQNAVASGAGAWTRAFVWGTNKAGTTTQAIKLKHVNIYTKTGGVLPANLNSVMSTYNTTPQDIGKLFDRTTKHVALFTAGQSNQAGYGGTAEALNTSSGAPIKDPLYPKGTSGKRSMWPACAASLGTSGYFLTVYNHAQGSSGLCANWVGLVSGYALNGYVKLGSFIAYGGRVFKATTSGGINDLAQMSKPPADGGTDGVITWSDFGPDTGFRGAATYGSIYFDPNGYMAGLMDAINASDSPRKMVYVAFGETDANMGISRAVYAASLVSFTISVLAAGAHKVGIGHTFGTAQFLTQYNNNLVPGVQDALAAFASDARVFSSLNAYAAFGALPTTPASGLGFIADNLHANDVTYDAGGAAMAASLLTQLAGLA